MKKIIDIKYFRKAINRFLRIHVVVRMLRKWWRKHGAKLLLLFMIISLCFWWVTGVGIASILMLTVPCGMQEVNTNKKLWYARQLVFLITGIINICA